MLPKELEDNLRHYQEQIDIVKASGFTSISNAGNELQNLLNYYTELLDSI